MLFIAKRLKLPKKLKSLENLGILLEILNEESDRYVPLSELKIKFKEKLDLDNEVDDVTLNNSLNNTLSFAEGINDKVGQPPIHTPKYLADIAQIWQTKLIDTETLLINGKKENCYMIKIKGIEVLNQLQLNKNIIKFNEASKRASNAIIILTFLLVALAILQISDLGQTLKNSLLFLAAFGLIVVEIRFLSEDLIIKIKRKPIGKFGQIIVISIFVIIFALIVSVSRFLGIPQFAIDATTTGLYGAYGFYILEKYLIDAISTNNKIAKFLISSILLIVFLFVIILTLSLIEIGIGFIGLPLASIGQIILSEDIGGVVGSWILYVILLLLGLNQHESNS